MKVEGATVPCRITDTVLLDRKLQAPPLYRTFTG